MSKAKPETPADALAALLASLGDPGDDLDQSAASCPEEEDAGVHQLVYSTLLWNATHAKASKAMRSLTAIYADYNDLRADLPAEIAAAMGSRYPKAEERAARLRAALNAVYERWHVTSLSPLAELPKRETRSALDELPGLPRFVTARVALVSFGAHATPVDDDTCAALIAAGVLEQGTDPDDASGKMERLVKAADGLATHRALEGWRESGFSTPGRKTKKTAKA